MDIVSGTEVFSRSASGCFGDPRAGKFRREFSDRSASGLLGDFISGILLFFPSVRGRRGDPLYFPVVANSFDW